MPEATINNGVIECGIFFIKDNQLCQRLSSEFDGMTDFVLFDEEELDDLYAVLHVRHMAQAYDKTYLDKIQRAADRMLYKGYPNDVLD